MTNRLGIPAALIVLPLCAALAIFMGYLLATPTDFGSYVILGMILLALAFPAILRWHHALLIGCWNASLIVFFLPGAPSLGETMAFVSLSLSLLTRTMTKQSRFIRVRSVEAPLFLLLGVILVTARLTGGIGAHALGSEVWGAKRYLSLLAAVVGYFALTAEAVPSRQVKLLTALFFLSGTTTLLSDLIYAAGPMFYFLFAFFPADVAYQQATTESTILRLAGPGWAAQSVLFFMLLRYGIRGIFDLSRLWRAVIFTLSLGITAMGGYRSSLIFLLLLLASLFLFEGLLRSRVFLVALLVGVVAGAFLVTMAERLPLSVQRSLSFLPIHIDPVAQQDAQSTLEWRLLMWKVVVPDVPKYLLLGKGFAFSGTDFRLTEEAVKRGMYAAYESTLISGNYHQGVLTTVIPFGIWGGIGLLWFWWAALRVLHRNYRHGDPSLRTINTFFLAYFWCRILFFLVFYGQFDLDFVHFTGAVGLSIALNGGIAKPPEPAATEGRVAKPALVAPYISASGQAVGR